MPFTNFKAGSNPSCSCTLQTRCICFVFNIKFRVDFKNVNLFIKSDYKIWGYIYWFCIYIYIMCNMYNVYIYTYVKYILSIQMDFHFIIINYISIISKYNLYNSRKEYRIIWCICTFMYYLYYETNAKLSLCENCM